MFFLIVVVWVNYPFKDPHCLIKKRPELCKMHQLIITILIFFWGFVYVCSLFRGLFCFPLQRGPESQERVSQWSREKSLVMCLEGAEERERDRLFHLLATRHAIGLMVHSREVNSLRLSGKMPSAISAAITPVFSVKCTSRNHSNMLVWCLRNITYYY